MHRSSRIGPQPLTLAGLRSAGRHLQAFVLDTAVIVEDVRRSGGPLPLLSAATDRSMPALALIRGAAALRACLGTALGLDALLAKSFGIEVSTDDIAGGLRLPRPRGITIGEGVSLGKRCTLMNDVTLRDSNGTRVGEGVVVSRGAVVLGGARIGAYAHIGAKSVVRGAVRVGAVVGSAPVDPVSWHDDSSLAA